MTGTLRLGLGLILVTVTAFYAVLHFRVLQIGHPITQDEPGFVELTAAGNPYTHDGVLACGNVYGPAYALWARPFTAMIANPYSAHRWASTCALLATLSLLGWVLRREGIGGVETAAGLGIVYILNASSHALSASGDFLGAGLYLAALAVSRRGTWPALVGGLVLVILATFTKAYFALGWVIIASQLLLFGSPRRALAYLGLSGLVVLVLAGVLQAFAPYYVGSTYVVHQTAMLRRPAVLLAQTREFALLAGGLLLLAAMHWPRKRAMTLSLRMPWLSPGVDLWDWAVLLAAATLLGWLGWHSGNYLVYFYDLLLGPLVVVALRRLAARPQTGRVLLSANLLVLGWLLPPLPGFDNWAALEASVAETGGALLADPLLEPLARSHPNVELLSHGQTASILQALDDLSEAVPAAYRPLHRDLLERAQVTNSRLAAQEFAAVYLSYQRVGSVTVWSYDQRHLLKTLFAHYRPAGEIAVYLYATPYWDRLRRGDYAFHVTKWVPRPPSGTAAAP